MITKYKSMILVTMVAAASAHAGLSYQDGDKYLKLGGRVQVQYHLTEPTDGANTDELIFRRLRPYIEGSIHKDWKGKWQFDLGKGKIENKDAYMQYKGFDWGTVTIGNSYVHYSHEEITSSKNQQLVERTFVGDHNYGTPDRQVGLHLQGKPSDILTWDLSLAMAAVDVDNKKIDFGSVGSLNSGSDWIEGPMVGARILLSPQGSIKPSQGDFDGGLKSYIGLSGYTWSNDDDIRNEIEVDDDGNQILGKQDVENVSAFSVNAGLRAGGASVDVQFNSVDSELVDNGINNGLYANSETTLESYALEGGYMVVPSTIEVVAGWSSLDADGYSSSWDRLEFGLNYFIQKHDIKFQTTYRMGENKDGQSGNDVDELFVQAQYVF